MAAAAAELLDELMGSARNDSSGAPPIPTYKEQRICKMFLAEFCPIEMFSNTRVDRGEVCKQLHNPRVKEVYEQSDEYRKLGYEDELELECRRYLAEAEGRITSSEARLKRKKEMAEAIAKGEKYAAPADNFKLDEMNEEMATLLNIAEQFGYEGRVQDAQDVMDQIEQLREDKQGLAREAKLSKNQELAIMNEKPMEVCKTCGALIVEDAAADQIENHVGGKQHIGFRMIREHLERVDSKRTDAEKADAESKFRQWVQKRGGLARSAGRSNQGGGGSIGSSGTKSSSDRRRSRSPRRTSPSRTARRPSPPPRRRRSRSRSPRRRSPPPRHSSPLRRKRDSPSRSSSHRRDRSIRSSRHSSRHGGSGSRSGRRSRDRDHRSKRARSPAGAAPDATPQQPQQSPCHDRVPPPPPPEAYVTTSPLVSSDDDADLDFPLPVSASPHQRGAKSGVPCSMNGNGGSANAEPPTADDPYAAIISSLSQTYAPRGGSDSAHTTPPQHPKQTFDYGHGVSS